MSEARDQELLLAGQQAATAVQKLVERNEELVRENRRLKGRLRSVSAARSRLRRKVAQS